MATTFTAPVPGIVDCHRPMASAQTNVQRPAACAADLRIDGWLVQPSLNLLTRGDTCVRVRAQLMDLLLCLASRPGKVFCKDELLADVWEGRWIVESGLSRCVAELRAALGDAARQPRVIETITKRGYRLIAPVEVVPGPQAAPSPVVVAAAIEPAPADTGTLTRSLWQRLTLSARRSASRFVTARPGQASGPA